MRSFSGAIEASYCRNSLVPASLSRNSGSASAVRASRASSDCRIALDPMLRSPRVAADSSVICERLA